MPEETIMEHEGRITKVEKDVEHITFRLESLSNSISGLSSEIKGLKDIFEKYKWLIVLLIILLATDNNFVVSIAKKMIGM